MNRNPAVVVLIAYQSSLSPVEQVSVKQCLKVLGKHPIVVVAPEEMAVPRLLRHFPVERFAPACFQSVRTYNRLLLSTEFYDRFRDYEYILIHQLDAFVFRDELHEWCGRNYDFIGAPWIGMELPEKSEWRDLLGGLVPAHRFDELKGRMTVGNGGFSLRRPAVLQKILSSRTDLVHVWGDRHEDAFWGIAARVCFSDAELRIPSEEEALGFAFETQPEICFQRLGRMPFGCHAWDRIAPAFWRPWIRKAGWRIHVPGDGAWQDRCAALLRR